MYLHMKDMFHDFMISDSIVLYNTYCRSCLQQTAKQLVQQTAGVLVSRCDGPQARHVDGQEVHTGIVNAYCQQISARRL